MGSVSILKLKRDSTKFPLCEEGKVTAARRAKSSIRTKSCIGICYKECTDLEFG
jgi:hypothetical protein